MRRYLAVFWQPEHAAQNDSAARIITAIRGSHSRWTTVFAVRGLQVLCVEKSPADADLHLLQDQSGIVIGTLFKRGSDAREYLPAETFLSEHESDRITASGGRHLVANYWGSYVALLTDQKLGRQYALSSPAAFQPCFMTSFRGVHLVFTRAEDCIALPMIRFTVNQTNVAAQLASYWLATGDTAINEISQIIAGECLVISRTETSRSFYWNPCSIARVDPIDDPAKAIKTVREIGNACASAWASTHQHFLHELSGGLDSSIALACLRNAATPPRIDSVVYHSKGSDSDERYYARLAANRSGSNLIEIERNPDVDLRGLLNAHRTASPYLTIVDYSIGRTSTELALARGATAISTGSVGDCLFLRGFAEPAAADYYAMHGLRPHILAVALDVALVHRISFWRALKHVRDYRNARRGNSLDNYRRVIKQFVPPVDRLASRELHAMFDSDDQLVHRWYSSADDIPPAKLLQIASIAQISVEQAYDSPGDPERIHPLASQPLIEVCLRIPSYVHVHGSWDGAVFRKAFEDAIPREIYRRTTKGGMEEYAKALLYNNLTFVKEALLDGELVRAHLLDREKLEAALSRTPAKVAAGPADVFQCLDVELWLRAWHQIETRAAA